VTLQLTIMMLAKPASELVHEASAMFPSCESPEMALALFMPVKWSQSRSARSVRQYREVEDGSEIVYNTLLRL